MSHSPTLFTPAGTPLINRTVGEIVAESPSLARVFQSFGIEFCCQGGRTLREACDLKKITPAAVIDQLEAGMRDSEPPIANPALLPPVELVEHIVSTHHAYLKSELPRIHAMTQRVAHVHGGHTPSLREVHEIFTEMAAELESHLVKEETILFAAIVAMQTEGAAAIPLDGPIARMLQEHDAAGAALSKLRELTNGFSPPPEACNTYRALFSGLLELEDDLHRHIHLENSVLFPKALAMAQV
jgi:regulator of cell morphogenesis and NO signaling